MLELGYRNAILLAWDVDASKERQWELGPFSSSDGLRVIAGWTVASEEGGVPPAVARTFARAMTRYGRVTFPCSTIEVHSEDKQGDRGMLAAGSSEGGRPRFVRARSGNGRRQPELATALFNRKRIGGW